MPERGRTFFLETFGCQMNVHDSEKVAGTLISQGYQQVEDPQAADLVLYNTCSIRDKAEQKVFSRLGQYKKDLGEGKIYGVLGCVAQQEGEAIFERAPHVSLVVGSASYRRLPELLMQLEAGNRRVTGLDNDTDETFETELTRRANPYRAYLTIIEGCDQKCAFCVVPFTRGPERSRSSRAILDEARQLASAGYSEIQILGQIVNHYTDSSPAKLTFAQLLSSMAGIPGIRRVRFTTSHPRYFGQDIVDAISAHSNICNQVHLPVQSGSTRTLARMLRGYTREEYLEKIAMLRASQRNLALSTDIIVGFPGETEDDFAETLSLLEAVEFESIFSYTYSPRPNTQARDYEDAIPDEEKRRRLEAVHETQRVIQSRKHRALIGAMSEVLVEGRNAKLGQWIGRTTENRVLNFTVPESAPERNRLGTYAWVRVTGSFANSLVGEMLPASSADEAIQLAVPGRLVWTGLPVLGR